MAPLLHLYFKNPDGSLSWTAWWVLATVTLAWFAWGLSVLARPQWLTGRMGWQVGAGGRTAMRTAGLVACVVAVLVAVLILKTTPGKLY